MFLCGGERVERAEVSPLAGLWILLPRIQPVLARFQFPDHMMSKRFAEARVILTQIAASAAIRSWRNNFINSGN
jgi:hypothetical protein